MRCVCVYINNKSDIDLPYNDFAKLKLKKYIIYVLIANFVYFLLTQFVYNILKIVWIFQIYIHININYCNITYICMCE